METFETRSFTIILNTAQENGNIYESEEEPGKSTTFMTIALRTLNGLLNKTRGKRNLLCILSQGRKDGKSLRIFVIFVHSETLKFVC
jgi:hypothetical protein